MLNVIVLNVFMLNVIMLNVIMLNVIMLIVVAPFSYTMQIGLARLKNFQVFFTEKKNLSTKFSAIEEHTLHSPN